MSITPLSRPSQRATARTRKAVAPRLWSAPRTSWNSAVNAHAITVTRTPQVGEQQRARRPFSPQSRPTARMNSPRWHPPSPAPARRDDHDASHEGPSSCALFYVTCAPTIHDCREAVGGSIAWTLGVCLWAGCSVSYYCCCWVACSKGRESSLRYGRVWRPTIRKTHAPCRAPSMAGARAYSRCSSPARG